MLFILLIYILLERNVTIVVCSYIFCICIVHLKIVFFKYLTTAFRNRIWIKTRNLTVNEKKSLLVVLSVVETKMSFNRKLDTKTLKEKCDILSYIEKSMTDKEAADKFDVPKKTISTWGKNKENIFQALEGLEWRWKGCLLKLPHQLGGVYLTSTFIWQIHKFSESLFSWSI